MSWIENLSWYCHICKEKRPDRFISVHTRFSMINGVRVQENVRYCNDKPECHEGAQTYSHFSKETE